MSALTAAQADLDKAKAREQDARVAYNSARAHADSLRQQLTSGKGDSATPADLAEADAAVEYARLALQGASAPLADLSAALQRAKADDLCDSVAAMLPVLGADLADALTAVSVALAPVAPAAERYDEFVSDSVHRLEITARALAEQPPQPAPPGPVGHKAGTTVESPYNPDAKAPEPERPKPGSTEK